MPGFRQFKVILILLASTEYVNASIWSEWTLCSKACDVGTQARIRSSGNTAEREEQYCNLHYCDNTWDRCAPSCEPDETWGGNRICNKRCECALGPGYNKLNCAPQLDGCIMRKDPPYALGTSFNTSSVLRSCVVKSNSAYEVHMIGIYGDSNTSDYHVEIIPRGDTSKPIIIALSSYHKTDWTIESSVAITKVLYDSTIEPSSVREFSQTNCNIQDFKKLDGIDAAYGVYRENGGTIPALKKLESLYGEITSFTGYYNLKNERKITLYVGGNPLLILEYISVDFSGIFCQPVPLPPGRTNPPLSFGPWSAWSECSKSCDIGKQTRTRLVGGQDQVQEEQYCNLQFCPDIGTACVGNTCPSIPDDAGQCVNGMCYCKLGDGHNVYNCRPEFGNCIIRPNPPFARGHLDKGNKESPYPLLACVTNDNPYYEVHMIDVYQGGIFTVEVEIQQEVTKPIILALSSHTGVDWRIHTNVHLHEIIYSSYYTSPKILHDHNSACEYENIIYHGKNFSSGYGSDTNANEKVDTIRALQYIYDLYGPVTSFTGYYTLKESKTIRLRVGGNPLLIVPEHPTKTVNCTIQKLPENVSFPPIKLGANPYITTTPIPPTDAGLNVAALAVGIIVPVIMIVIIIIIIILFVKRKSSREALSRRERENKDLKAQDQPFVSYSSGAKDQNL